MFKNNMIMYMFMVNEWTLSDTILLHSYCITVYKFAVIMLILRSRNRILQSVSGRV